jgi:hypothetical protein
MRAGLLFCLTWGKASLIVSETFTHMNFLRTPLEIDYSVPEAEIINRGNYDWHSLPYEPHQKRSGAGGKKTLVISWEEPVFTGLVNQPQPPLRWYQQYFLSQCATLVTPYELFWFGAKFPEAQNQADIICLPFNHVDWLAGETEDIQIPVLSAYPDGGKMRRSLSYIREPLERFNSILPWKFLIKDLSS